MKTLFFTIAISLFWHTTFANNKGPGPRLTATSREISHILNSDLVDEVVENDVTAAVLFILNDLRQIVVLNVQSNNIDVQNYIKNRLNYKEVSSHDLMLGQQYQVVVNFKVADSPNH